MLTYDDGEFLDDYADRPLDLDLFPSTRVSIAEKIGADHREARTIRG